MENKLPPDRLDAFLQKVLEGYAPTPPDDVWADIEAQLPPAASSAGVAPRIQPAKAGWWAVAAAALLGIVAVQHGYYNQRIQHLSTQLEAVKDAQPLKAGVHYPSSDEFIEGAPSYAGADTGSEEKQAPAATDAARGNIAATGKAARQTGANLKAQQLHTDEQQTAFRIPPPAWDAGSGKAPEQPLPEQINTAKAVAVGGAEWQRLPGVPMIGAINRQYHLHSSPLLASAAPEGMTKVLRPHWALKVRVMPMRTRIQLNRIPTPDPGPGGGGPGNDRNRVFSDPEVVAGKILVAGLMAERSLAGRWTLSLGAELLRTQANATHYSDFEIRERDHHGGGHGHPPRPRHSHDFDYDLHTAAGLTAVSLRVTETDTMRSLNEDEIISFSVNTRQRTTRVAFPLLLGYRLERSRWSIQPKLGLMAGFTFERGVEVANVAISGADNVFEPRVNPVAELEDRLTFGLDAVASVGLACRISPEWEIGIEPTFMHSLGQWSGGPYAGAGALGVGAYAAYRF